ncbi:adaptor protein MecA [Eubacterium sp. MSJ-13]|uniref:adaptor protein MecA n=1 Tax=Eubacterium sp. MSJ-13 TaxID=2841513 RepID=UPI001C10690B|nr:adaptor protein MecA [Eubacterium sp. MSJ-13]MBU5479574.1 adaptor protein MecA [Eubacterium sp. MSJ-13]
MRIEKINDNQIRCTLNKKDLSDRELRISELAYGTDKAKALFRDMVQQASYEFGFDAENIPLMIEAIPMYPDTLVLLITKVEDPDELDTRFSTFSDDPDSSDYEQVSEYTFDDEYDDDDDDIYELAGNINPDDDETIPFSQPPSYEENTDFISLSEALSKEPRPKTTGQKILSNNSKIFSFNSLNDVSELADIICNLYKSSNTLYKDDKKGNYILIMQQGELSPEAFNKICNLTSEYGTQLKNTSAGISYFEEHFEPLIKNDALQKLV